jgi:hypothetical protein
MPLTPRHASYVAVDPAFRTQTWMAYVPAAGGVQSNLLDGDHSRPTDQLVPS